jgi:hypothetical protein
MHYTKAEKRPTRRKCVTFRCGRSSRVRGAPSARHLIGCGLGAGVSPSCHHPPSVVVSRKDTSCIFGPKKDRGAADTAETTPAARLSTTTHATMPAHSFGWMVGMESVGGAVIILLVLAPLLLERSEHADVRYWCIGVAVAGILDSVRLARVASSARRSTITVVERSAGHALGIIALLRLGCALLEGWDFYEGRLPQCEPTTCYASTDLMKGVAQRCDCEVGGPSCHYAARSRPPSVNSPWRPAGGGPTTGCGLLYRRGDLSRHVAVGGGLLPPLR